MDIGVGAFTIIEALVYMSRVDVCVPVLVRLDMSPFPIRFPTLVCVHEKMSSNGVRMLGCIVRTYLRHCRNGPQYMSVFVMFITSFS